MILYNFIIYYLCISTTFADSSNWAESARDLYADNPGTLGHPYGLSTIKTMHPGLTLSKHSRFGAELWFSTESPESTHNNDYGAVSVILVRK